MMYQIVIPGTVDVRQYYVAFTPRQLQTAGPSVSVLGGNIQFEITRMVVGQPYRVELNQKEYFVVKRDAKKVDVFWNKG